ncbi:hypothetical protein CLLI_11660 [Clostridium liquoris]|uniref:Uncharacterized protein n=1 Tax=Clostridium liquoris TaxID=1289519 RepID=A0A2T0B5D9_9CLOT|nr:hypothetical protein [Clostridium liquoris]PRR79104.1 hypothetical protein CLLI_11660 [Clostridium liquoris]
MGKHKRHRKKENIERNNANNNNNNTENNNSGNNGSNNIMEMLNNIDEEQISSLLSSLNLNNANAEANIEDDNTNTNANTSSDNADKTLQILNAIKPMVNAERGDLIDRLIQLYSISRIINK